MTVTYELADAGPDASFQEVDPEITRDEALKVYDQLRAACVRKDAKAIWGLMSEEAHRYNERHAALLRTTPDVLRTKFGYSGTPPSFTGLEFIRAESFDDSSPLKEYSLCYRAREWVVLVTLVQLRNHIVIVSRPDERRLLIYLERDEQQRIRMKSTRWLAPNEESAL